MNTIEFSHGLKPWAEVSNFIEIYFHKMGLKVFASPSYEVDDIKPYFDLSAEKIDELRDAIIDHLIGNDFPIQPEIKRPDVNPDTIFTRKSSLILPNEEDLKRDYSKLPGGDIEPRNPRKHYKLK